MAKQNGLLRKLLPFALVAKRSKKCSPELLLPSAARFSVFRNRTSRGGVITKGAGLIREGEDGNGLSSRWYPDTLAKRIKTISALNSKLTFAECNGFELVRKYIRHKHAVFFVDPPYTKAARRLYSHWQ